MGFSNTGTVDEDTVNRQVEKICTSPEFKSKQLLCNFLSYIVSEYLAGTLSDADNNITTPFICLDKVFINDKYDPINKLKDKRPVHY